MCRSWLLQSSRYDLTVVYAQHRRSGGPTRHTHRYALAHGHTATHSETLKMMGNVALGHVQTKEMEEAQRSAQRAIAAIAFRPEVKLVTGAQLSEVGS